MSLLKAAKDAEKAWRSEDAPKHPLLKVKYMEQFFLILADEIEKEEKKGKRKK